MADARNKPHFVAPMLCKPVPQLPAPGDWFYEVKHDGRRAMVVKDSANVSLFSLDGKPLDCPEAREAVRKLPVKSAVIDCELVALPPNPQGSSRDQPEAVSLYASDLLHLNGRDLTSEPIERRKERLCTITLNSAVLFAPSLDCDPGPLVEHIKDLSLEGIVAKRKGSTYEPGKCSGAWLRMRLTEQAEFFIGGYAHGDPIDSVLVGYRQGRQLLFAGKVHAGLTPKLQDQILDASKDLECTPCPFADLPDECAEPPDEGITAEKMEDFIWLRPKLKVQVAFREWTNHRRLRQATFSRLTAPLARPDRNP